MSSSQQDRLLLIPPALKRLSPDSSVWNPLPLTSPDAASSGHSRQGSEHSSPQNSSLRCQEAIPRHLSLSGRPPRSTIGGVMSQFNLLHVRNRKSPLSCIGSALGKLTRRFWRQDCRTAQVTEEPNLDWGQVSLDDFYMEQTVQEDSGDWASLDGGELAFCQLDECISNDFSEVDLASDAHRNSDSPPPLSRHTVDGGLRTNDAESKNDTSDCVSTARRCRKLSWRRCKSLHHMRSRWTVRTLKKLKSDRNAYNNNKGGRIENVREPSIRVERVGDSLEPTLVFSCGHCSPSQRVKATKKMKRKRRVKMIEGVVRRILARRSRAVNKYLDLKKRETSGSQDDDSARETDSEEHVGSYENSVAPLICTGAENCAFSLCDDTRHESLCIYDGSKDSLPVVCGNAFYPFVYQGSKEVPSLADDGAIESLGFARDSAEDLSPIACARGKYLTTAIRRSVQNLCPLVSGEDVSPLANVVKKNDAKTRKKQLKAETEKSSSDPAIWPTPEVL